MTYHTIISAAALHEQMNNPDWLIIDCRFSLADADAGFKAYRHGHLPKARYAHLNKDLSAPVSDLTGRHPLPDFKILTDKLSHWGATNQTQIVAYDDGNIGFAARLWWLLQTMGHHNVAVLDGGFTHWLKQKLPITTVLPQGSSPVQFRTYLDDRRWVQASDVENGLARNQIRLIDARTEERFQGLQEPIDPVAGHIPKAINRPFQHNLDENGLFKSPNALRDQFLDITKPYSPDQVVHMCGSGVTAINNLLAMELAGLEGSKLYVGSWSEWIRNKNRAVATRNASNG